MDVKLLKLQLVVVDKENGFDEYLENAGGEILLKDKIDLRLNLKDLKEASEDGVLRKYNIHLQEDGAVVVAET
jgi:hypothetical protein